MIISIGFKVDNERVVQFRKWANQIIKYYTIKGWVNILYKEQIISIYTNKVDLQRKLNKIFGEPTKEFKVKRSISGSVWEVPFKDKTKV